MKQIKIAKKGQIDIYSTFISTFYLSTFEDIVNVILSSPRHKYLFEKYHFNPIPITEQQRKYFINLETLHLYNKNDNEFKEDEKIKKRIYCYKISYSEYITIKEDKNNMNEYKIIEYTKEDREKYGNTIPKNITEIGNKCFYCYENLSTITIPNSVTKLNDYCFYHCSNLTTIKLSTNLKEIRKECFYYCEKISSIEIPNSVTKLNDGCFYECLKLTTIELSSNLKEIGSGMTPKWSVPIWSLLKNFRFFFYL